LTKNAVHEMLKRLEKQCGVRLHAHLLRHTFANLYIKVGDTGKLQKILGHSRIETTSRYYAQPEFSDIQKQHRFASPTAQLAYKKRGKKPSKGQ
jgi:integrase